MQHCVMCTCRITSDHDASLAHSHANMRCSRTHCIRPALRAVASALKQRSISTLLQHLCISVIYCLHAVSTLPSTHSPTHPVAAVTQEVLERYMAQPLAAGRAMRGALRQCQRWGCTRREQHVRQFKVCSYCKAAAYCSRECQVRGGGQGAGPALPAGSMQWVCSGWHRGAWQWLILLSSLPAIVRTRYLHPTVPLRLPDPYTTLLTPGPPPHPHRWRTSLLAMGSASSPLLCPPLAEAWLCTT